VHRQGTETRLHGNRSARAGLCWGQTIAHRA
jgi:hypothetical protein